jgi:dephospho-CoA kinase
MRRLALTGGIGTGKSQVAARLRHHGVPVVDADVLAREAVAPGTPGLAAVVDRFGPRVLRQDGALDRAALASIVFADPAARRDLEALVHPVVWRLVEAFFDRVSRETPDAVAEIPLLYETGRDRDFDAVIVAACSPETQLARVMARDGSSADEAARRMAAQWPIARKRERADYLIDTEGTLAETDAQVDRLVEQWRATAPKS